MHGMNNPVNHPEHYTQHPSGIECIQITEHMNFNLGSAVKYIWRADLKLNVIQDLEKAAWYLAREIERRKINELSTTSPDPSNVPPPGAPHPRNTLGVHGRDE